MHRSANHSPASGSIRVGIGNQPRRRLQPRLLVSGIAGLILFGTGAFEVAAQSARNALADRKSPGTAFAWSAVGSLIPTAVGLGLATTGANHSSELIVAVAGIYVGPSLGHFYAGQPGRGITGIAVRTGILAATALALTQTGVCVESCQDGEEVDEVVVAGTAIVLTAVSGLVDIFSAPRSARRSNEQAGFAFRPWISPERKTVGIAVQLVP